MSKEIRAALIGVAVGVAGLLMTFVYAPVGVALGFFAIPIGFRGVFGLNTRITANLFYVVVLLQGAVVFLASDSILLGLSASLPWFAATAHPIFFRRYAKGLDIVLPTLWVVAAGLFAVSWGSVGHWRWAALPSLLLSGTFSLVTLRGIRELWAPAASKIRPALGHALGDFTLPIRGAGDATFTLSEHRGSLLLLAFLRGDWCPLCQVMLRVLLAGNEQLKSHGIELIVISPSGGDTRDTYMDGLGVDVTMLIDAGAEKAKELGITQLKDRQGEAVPLPVSILIDRDGVIRHITQPHDVSSLTGASNIKKLLESIA